MTAEEGYLMKMKTGKGDIDGVTDLTVWNDFEVEIKRSKSDMLADFHKKHGHKDKKNRIVQLYYAFPKELLPKVEDLVPPECGIITVDLYGNSAYARMYKDATRKKGAKKLTQAEQLKVARLGAMRIWSFKEKLNLLKRKK